MIFEKRFGTLTDSYKRSLRVVVLHNGNILPSLPLAKAANMKETNEIINLLLKKVKFGAWYLKTCENWRDKDLSKICFYLVNGTIKTEQIFAIKNMSYILDKVFTTCRATWSISLATAHQIIIDEKYGKVVDRDESSRTSNQSIVKKLIVLRKTVIKSFKNLPAKFLINCNSDNCRELVSMHLITTCHSFFRLTTGLYLKNLKAERWAPWKFIHFWVRRFFF